MLSPTHVTWDWAEALADAKRTDKELANASEEVSRAREVMLELSQSPGRSRCA